MSLLCSLRSKQKKNPWNIYFSLDKKSNRSAEELNKKIKKSVAINTHIHILLDVDGLWCRDREWNEWLFDGITDVVAEFFDDFIQILSGFVIHGDLVWWH